MGTSVRYIVDDVDAAVGFYRDHLGFAVEMHPAPGFARLRRGELVLLLNAPGAGGAGRAGGEPEPGGWNRFRIETDGLDALVADLRARGASFRGEPVEGRGGRQVLVEDPAGNVVELFEPADREDPTSVRDAVLELERGYWGAAGDRAYYEAHTARDARFLLPVGALDATATVEAISGADPWESFELDDVVVHRPGADTTVLTYVASAQRRDAPPYRALVSSCYRRTGDGWELLVHHQTPLDG